MKRRAFTLLELLVVVIIIMLLISILVPSMARARSLARSAVCANNLHELGLGIALARQPGGGLTINHAFPGMEWPSIPATVMTSQAVFHCPEAPLIYNDTGSWTIVTNQIKDQYKNDNPTLFNFLPGVNVNVVVGPDPGGQMSPDNYPWPATLVGHTQYRIDDGFDKDMDDVVLDVDNSTLTVTNMLSGYYGTAAGVLTIDHYGQPYPGWSWSMSSSPAKGATFNMGGPGASNYGVNYLTARPTVADDTIVLLDYDLLIANNGETPSMLSHLTASSRHLGKINVLYADGSVRASWGVSLNPTINPNPWSPTP